MGFKEFCTCFDDFWFSRSANSLHDSMYKVWAKKIENLFLFLMQYKWVLRSFARVLTTFGFRGRQIRYMTPCIRYGGKISKIFFLFLKQYKWVLRSFAHVLKTFVFRGRQIRRRPTINNIITNKIPLQARPAGPPPGRQSRTAGGEAYTGASLSIVSDYMTSREAFSYFTLSISKH